ncbi:MAG: YchF family ATPase, partial [Bdellovibrionales bacterium]|nr:YchF family ATPase [Bdellovibrionales bacterium]
LRDMDVINTELMLADLDSMIKRIQKVEKMAKSGDKKAIVELALYTKIRDALDQGKPARVVVPESEDEKKLYKELHLLTSKAVLYVCNVAEDDMKTGNEFSNKVAARAKEEGNESIIISGAIESELSQLSDEERIEYLQSLDITEAGIQRLIKAAYKLLGLETYFTAGEKEVRAWTIRRGTKAPQAAGVIHTDFERGFIRAETYHCTDLFEYKSEQAIKEAGKYRSEGKEYVVKDGDVLLFRFNV